MTTNYIIKDAFLLTTNDFNEQPLNSLVGLECSRFSFIFTPKLHVCFYLNHSGWIIILRKEYFWDHAFNIAKNCAVNERKLLILTLTFIAARLTTTGHQVNDNLTVSKHHRQSSPQGWYCSRPMTRFYETL